MVFAIVISQTAFRLFIDIICHTIQEFQKSFLFKVSATIAQLGIGLLGVGSEIARVGSSSDCDFVRVINHEIRGFDSGDGGDS